MSAAAEARDASSHSTCCASATSRSRPVAPSARSPTHTCASRWQHRRRRLSGVCARYVYSRTAEKEGFSLLFIRHHPERLRSAHDARKTRLLQSLQRALRDRAARLALQIPDVVEQPAAALQYPVQLPVEDARVELARKAEHGRIVNDPIKTAILKSGYDLERIAHYLPNFGIIKKGPRPGIEPRYLLRARIKLDGDDLLRRLRRLDRGIAEARGCI